MEQSDHIRISTHWFGVRCLFRVSDGTFEERVTIWEADAIADAIGLAEIDATEYAEQLGEGARYCGLAQAFAMVDPPRHGAEVFSLLRQSDLEEREYLDHFFDTGDEAQTTVN